MRCGGEVRLHDRKLAVSASQVHCTYALCELLKREAPSHDGVTQDQNDAVAFGVAGQNRRRAVKFPDPRRLAHTAITLNDPSATDCPN